MRMEVSKIPKYRNLTLTERILISQLKNKGKSNKEIARVLGRNASTIGREIRNNSYKGKFYEPLYANGRAMEKRKRAWRAKHPLKNKKVYAYTLDKLRCGWSPQQISGRLRLVCPNDSTLNISHESIYRFIYSDHPRAQGLRLWEYLRRKQKKRRRRLGRKVHRVRIPQRVSIHKRPKAVDKREEVGHWEGESIVGRGRTNGLHTEYERFASFPKVVKLRRINSTETARAQKKIFSPLPKKARKSTTLANGSEMVKHTRLS